MTPNVERFRGFSCVNCDFSMNKADFSVEISEVSMF